jgi:hypothetical protein
MRIFSFFLEDDRYSVPSLEFVSVETVAGAKKLAAARLASSAHHVRIEVREDDRSVFELLRTSQ